MNVQGLYWNTLLSVPRKPPEGDPLWGDTIFILTPTAPGVDSSPYAKTLTNGTISSDIPYNGLPTYDFSPPNAQGNLTPLDWVAPYATIGTGEFCIEMWIYVTSYTVNNIFDRIAAWSTNVISISTTGDLTITCSDIGTSSYSIGCGNVPLNTWTHVAAFRDNSGPVFSELRGYKNGVQQSTIGGVSKAATLNGQDSFGVMFGVQGTGDPAYNSYACAGFRMTKGTRYNCAGGASFTPDVPFFPSF